MFNNGLRSSNTVLLFVNSPDTTGVLNSIMCRKTGAPLLQHGRPFIFIALVFLLRTGFVSSQPADSPSSSKDDDDDGKKHIPKTMIIGLSVGFGSVLIVLICCCCAFKFIGCKDDKRKTSTLSSRKIAWDR